MSSATTPRPPTFDQLSQIHELNRLFLGFLQSRARRNADCLGLPEAAKPLLLEASSAVIDAVAEFPRALFTLAPDVVPASLVRDPIPDLEEGARQSVYITLLLCAWNLSRQSVHQARVLLGMRSQTMQQLRALQLAELPRLARAPNLVTCAFSGADWLWTELLTQTRPDAREQLALVALQPGPADQWPRRGKSRRLL